MRFLRRCSPDLRHACPPDPLDVPTAGATGHASRTAIRTAVLLAAFVATASASAQTTATFAGRASVNYLYFFGGFAISSVEGEVGAPPPTPGDPREPAVVTTPDPATLEIAGTNHHDIHYLFWDGELDTTWAQTQTYAFGSAPGGGTAIRGAGASTISQSGTVCGLGNCGVPSALHHSTNSQIIEFGLSGTTGYTLTGAASGDQLVDLQVWNTVSERWISLIGGAISTPDRAFDFSGELVAGRYRMANQLSVQVGGIPSPVVSAWDYTLTLPSAAPVPEPATVALWSVGLLGVMARMRRGRRLRIG